MVCKYRAVAIVSSGLPRPVVLASHCDGRVACSVPWSHASPMGSWVFVAWSGFLTIRVFILYMLPTSSGCFCYRSLYPLALSERCSALVAVQ
ncbi:hypothetical protein V8E52_000862 [Russula decolorans]